MIVKNDARISIQSVERANLRDDVYKITTKDHVDLDHFTYGLAYLIETYLRSEGINERVHVSDTSDTPPFTSRGIAIGGNGSPHDGSALAGYEVMGNRGPMNDEIPRNTYSVDRILKYNQWDSKIPQLDVILKQK